VVILLFSADENLRDCPHEGTLGVLLMGVTKVSARKKKSCYIVEKIILEKS